MQFNQAYKQASNASVQSEIAKLCKAISEKATQVKTTKGIKLVAPSSKDMQNELDSFLLDAIAEQNASAVRAFVLVRQSIKRVWESSDANKTLFAKDGDLANWLLLHTESESSQYWDGFNVEENIAIPPKRNAKKKTA